MAEQLKDNQKALETYKAGLELKNDPYNRKYSEKKSISELTGNLFRAKKDYMEKKLLSGNEAIARGRLNRVSASVRPIRHAEHGSNGRICEVPWRLRQSGRPTRRLPWRWP